MRLDSLIRLIEAADFSTFREIAAIALKKRGFQDTLMTDGWRDGGRDFRVAVVPPNPLEFAIQTSVERDWRGKMADDAAKVKEKLGITDLLFVSSRRIPDADFEKVADAIVGDHSVRVQKMDAQGIATRAITDNFVGQILDVLGIPHASINRRQLSKAALREDVAYAFSFFGAEASAFRKAVVEQAIVSAMFLAGSSLNRNSLVANVSDALGLAANQQAQVSGAIDRMLQDGRLSGGTSALMLNADTASVQESVVAIREHDWRMLREDVRKCLNRHSPRANITELELNAVMEPIGALSLSMGRDAAEGFENVRSHAAVQSQLRSRLRSLHAALDACSISDDTQRGVALEELTTIAVNSNICRHLIAGEVFMAFTAIQTPALVRALGPRAQVTVLLDSSVSIPMLASLLYEPTGRHHSLAAHRAFEQLDAHGFDIVLPWDYLEETAAHMLDAFLAYGPVIDIEPDLRASTNAFVSHYVSLKILGRLGGRTFVQYLQGFGFDERLARGEYYRARDEFMRRLSKQFEHYRIVPRKLGLSSKQSERRAEEALAHAENERGIRRQKVTARHDIRTIAHLYDAEQSGKAEWMLCTWDNLHFYVRELGGSGSSHWHVVDPALLADMLSLVASEELPSLISPSVVAMSITDEVASLAADVWDVLVHLEKGKLHDADLLSQAREFKQSYLQSGSTAADFKSVSNAWEKWKSAHGLTELASDTLQTPPSNG